MHSKPSFQLPMIGHRKFFNPRFAATKTHHFAFQNMKLGETAGLFGLSRKIPMIFNLFRSQHDKSDQNVQKMELKIASPDSQLTETSTEKFNEDIELAVQPMVEVNSIPKVNCCNKQVDLSNDRSSDQSANKISEIASSSVNHLLTPEEAAPVHLQQGRRLAAVVKRKLASKNKTAAHKKQKTKKAKKVHRKHKNRKANLKKSKLESDKKALASTKKIENTKERSLMQNDKSPHKISAASETTGKTISHSLDKKANERKLLQNSKKPQAVKKMKLIKKKANQKHAKKSKKTKHNKKFNKKSKLVKANHHKSRHLDDKKHVDKKSNKKVDLSQKKKLSDTLKNSKSESVKTSNNLKLLKNASKPSVNDINKSKLPIANVQPTNQAPERKLRSTEEDFYHNNLNLPAFDVNDYQKKLSHLPKNRSGSRRRLVNEPSIPTSPSLKPLNPSPKAQNPANTSINSPAADINVFSEEDQAKKFVTNLEKDMRQTRNAIDNIEDKLVTMKKNESDIKTMLQAILKTKKKKNLV